MAPQNLGISSEGSLTETKFINDESISTTLKTRSDNVLSSVSPTQSRLRDGALLQHTQLSVGQPETS
ncbi:hypothetical protein PV11_09958 [Exophiala sideris]|uniref:Uncharacterized protein n=1 Tax=Exophiala sideris TaxID=1016849 RepID=A0A0D1VQ54_9EURO|nr:hypothetical protein PV11_09958 [Exophiala sideris]